MRELVRLQSSRTTGRPGNIALKERREVIPAGHQLLSNHSEIEAIMNGPGPDINTMLSGDGPIPREQVLSWIDAAADSDLPTLSKLYRLTGDGYYRIQPELGRGPTCALIQRYLLGCIRDGVTDNHEIQERYEAAETLHVWFRHLAGMDRTSEVLTAAANGLMKLYLESGDEVRVAIETGFLEHALETAALRPYFETVGL